MMENLFETPIYVHCTFKRKQSFLQNFHSNHWPGVWKLTTFDGYFICKWAMFSSYLRFLECSDPNPSRWYVAEVYCSLAVLGGLRLLLGCRWPAASAGANVGMSPRIATDTMDWPADQFRIVQVLQVLPAPGRHKICSMPTLMNTKCSSAWPATKHDIWPRWERPAWFF